MIERIAQINKALDDSIFLFSARQTGKSTALRQQFPGSIYIECLHVMDFFKMLWSRDI